MALSPTSSGKGAAAGGSGIGAVLFDSTLGAGAASIDTGAGGIAQTQNVLEVFIYARTDQAVTFSTFVVTLNNDATAIYDLMRLQGLNSTASAGNVRASAGWTLDAPGSLAGANYFSATRITFPNYRGAVGNTVGEATVGQPDPTAAEIFTELLGLGYRSTAVISRLRVAAGAGNLVAGSRLLILGR